jgi:hypothetical protein
MNLVGTVVSEKKNFEFYYMFILWTLTLACDLDLEDITKPYVNSEGLHPRIIVAKYQQNRASGFRGEDFWKWDWQTDWLTDWLTDRPKTICHRLTEVGGIKSWFYKTPQWSLFHVGPPTRSRTFYHEIITCIFVVGSLDTHDGVSFNNRTCSPHFTIC